MKNTKKIYSNYKTGLDNTESLNTLSIKGTDYGKNYFKEQVKAGKNKKAFTLVELIIVITILAILATIAFVSFQSYTKQARDGNRLTTMKNIEKGLNLLQIKSGTYPEVESDGKVTITASGITIGYQGYFGDTNSRVINMNETPLDPSDKSKYIYATNEDKTKFQLLGFMEENSQISFLNQAYATSDYSNKKPIVLGNNIGIILNEDNSPINENVDTSSGSINYKVVFKDNDIVIGSGNTLFSNIYNRRDDLINNKTYASLDESLVGYWDMETLTGGLLKDFSKYGNHGTLSGGVVVGGVEGINGKATYFDSGTGQYIEITNNPSINFSGAITMAISIKTQTIKPMWYTPILKEINCLPNNRSYLLGIYNGILGISVNSCSIFPGGSNSFSKFLISDGKWNQSVAKADGYNWTVYKNGFLKEKTIATTLPIQTNSNLYIGNKYGTYGLDGIIDEVRIYNRALSDQEIKELYNATK